MIRRKLFSQENEGGMILRKVICRDCGHTLETAESVSRLICPNCGGKRFDISLFPQKERISLFDKDKYDDTEFEKTLKENAGKVMKMDDYEKTFSDHAEDLIEKGFATVEGNKVTIDNNAYGFEKMFSKIVITMTKTMDLDPRICTGVLNKEDVISNLIEKHLIPSECLSIIKRAHCLPEMSCCGIKDAFESSEDWMRDSNIVPDLRSEYAGEKMGIEQFVKVLRNRYPDAPKDIIDILFRQGVISINGSEIEIK